MFRLLVASDKSLADRVMRGERDAFGKLVERYMGVVRSIACAYVRNRTDADDVVQEAFVRAFQSLPSLQDREKFGPWLTTIARRTAIDYAARRDRLQLVEHAAWTNTPANTPSTEANEMEELLAQQLERLGEDQREILVMRYFSGRSVKEVAALLEITPDTAAKRLQRAREALSEQMLQALAAERSATANTRSRVAQVMALIAPLPMPWTNTGATAGAAAAGSLFGAKALLFVAPIVLAGAGMFLAYEMINEPAPPPAQETPAPVPVPVVEAQPPAAPQEAPATVPAPPPDLDLHLKGTVTGANPTALIALSTGKPAQPFHIGDTLLPDVSLLEIHESHAVVDNHGTLLTLRIEAEPPVPQALPDLAGAWTLTILREGSPEVIYSLLLEGSGRNYRVTSWRGGNIVEECTAELRDNTAGRPAKTLRCEFHGLLKNELLELGDTVSFLSDDKWQSAEGILDIPDGAGNDSPQKLPLEALRLTRSPELTASLGAQRTLREQANILTWALTVYAEAHDGQYPPALDDLVPKYLPDHSAFANTKSRAVTYYPGKHVPDTSWQNLASTAPDPRDPNYPDLAMEHEALLQNAGILDALFPDVVVELVYKLPLHLVIINGGGGLTVMEWPSEKERGIDATLAVCKNNLKQLGLVCKMFANEHRDFTPAGWASVYPEYLSDPTVLTCPKDPFGTESYDYLHPATHVTYYAEELGVSESQIPMIIDKTAHSGGSKNVLFADGHVEAINPVSSEWQTKVQPFLLGN